MSTGALWSLTVDRRRATMPKSSFGSQSYSQRGTAPSYGFGAATRECASRVFVSPEHSLSGQFGELGPGPAADYAFSPAILPHTSKQPDGRKSDPPAWAFGRAQRFRQSGAEGDPAPNRYSLAPSVGRQPLSRCSSEPLFGFGTVRRPCEHKPRNNHKRGGFKRDASRA